MFSGNSVVNFTVGLNDPWWIVDPAIDSSTGLAANVLGAVLETNPSQFPGRTGTGSRVLGIGDTIASFVNVYGSATPGGTLDLHYWPGVDSGGSYVVYDRALIPQSLTTSVYFGTLRGGPTNDDAWDPGVILPMLARNALYGGNLGRTYSFPLDPLYPISTPLPDLSPDMARIEGLAQAMAANVLQSPYLADTQGTGLASLVDIRDITGLSASQLSPYSAPAIRAFAWEVILQASSLPSPGVASDWANINPSAAAPFFPAPGGLTGSDINGNAIDIEPLNIYTQINLLKQAQSTVILANVFTDAVLTNLGSPFGIPWPRPTTGAYTSFVTYWGLDPTGPLPPVVLSMAKATQVNQPLPQCDPGLPQCLRRGSVLHGIQPDRGQAVHPDRHDHPCARGRSPVGGGPAQAAANLHLQWLRRDHGPLGHPRQQRRALLPPCAPPPAQPFRPPAGCHRDACAHAHPLTQALESSWLPPMRSGS